MHAVFKFVSLYRPLGYERVYLPLCEVADTPFHMQGDDILTLMTLKYFLYKPWNQRVFFNLKLS